MQGRVSRTDRRTHRLVKPENCPVAVNAPAISEIGLHLIETENHVSVANDSPSKPTSDGRLTTATRVPASSLSFIHLNYHFVTQRGGNITLLMGKAGSLRIGEHFRHKRKLRRRKSRSTGGRTATYPLLQPSKRTRVGSSPSLFMPR